MIGSDCRCLVRVDFSYQQLFGHYDLDLSPHHFAMECHNPTTCRVLPVFPKPLRCGEQGYLDLVKGFCSPPALLHSLEQACHARVPFELSHNVESVCGPEGLVTDAVSRPLSLHQYEGSRLESWSPCEVVRPLSWNPHEAIKSSLYRHCETTRLPSWSCCAWSPYTDCCKYCSKVPYSEIRNFPNIGKDGSSPLTADCQEILLNRMESPDSQRAMVRPLRNSALSQPVDIMLSSSGDRVFKCDHPECTKSFTRKEELTRHKRTHSNERAFECQICSRKFIRKDHMTKHLATHEDVSKRRRYLCKEPGCSRRYTRSDALSRHRAAAHHENLSSESFIPT